MDTPGQSSPALSKLLHVQKNEAVARVKAPSRERDGTDKACLTEIRATVSPSTCRHSGVSSAVSLWLTPCCPELRATHETTTWFRAGWCSQSLPTRCRSRRFSPPVGQDSYECGRLWPVSWRTRRSGLTIRVPPLSTSCQVTLRGRNRVSRLPEPP